MESKVFFTKNESITGINNESTKINVNNIDTPCYSVFSIFRDKKIKTVYYINLNL